MGTAVPCQIAGSGSSPGWPRMLVDLGERSESEAATVWVVCGRAMAPAEPCNFVGATGFASVFFSLAPRSGERAGVRGATKVEQTVVCSY